MSKVLHRPVNQLINEAVRAYLGARTREAERDLEAKLEVLRSYRARDPNFEQAIEAFAQAEVAFDDPAEGQALSPGGSVRRQIRKRLNA